jgi:hypothetical protein
MHDVKFSEIWSAFVVPELILRNTNLHGELLLFYHDLTEIQLSTV